MRPVSLPSKEVLRRLYRNMVLVRRTDEKIASLYPEQEIRCPVHLSIGQEAAASGVSTALQQKDYVFSTHRCHSHYLTKGGGLKEMFAELYGKASGCSKGKGGSMHLVDPDQGILGASAIVGGTIPLAVGAALGSRLKKRDQVAVAFFGDAAAEQGVLYEGLNFAALKKLPVLFVCENNFFATHSPISDRQVLPNIWERGTVYGVPGYHFEGDDVIPIYQAALQMVERARRGEGPSFLECQAYRWKEHVGPNEDYNLGYRTKEELEAWKARCPIRNLEKKLLDLSLMNETDFTRIREEIDREIEEAVSFAKASPLPEPEELMTEID